MGTTTEVLPQDWEACLAKWHNLLGKTPDLHGILLLIGMQESGMAPRTFSKEQKQDLMHVGLCTLLAQDGIFELEYADADGWPHFKLLKPLTFKKLAEEEQYLKSKIIQYTLKKF